LRTARALQGGIEFRRLGHAPYRIADRKRHRIHRHIRVAALSGKAQHLDLRVVSIAVWHRDRCGSNGWIFAKLRPKAGISPRDWCAMLRREASAKSAASRELQ